MQQALRRAGMTLAIAAAAGVVLVPGALAHSQVSPPVALKGHGQVFTLSVPTEEEDLTTTQVDLSVPDGFTVFSIAPTPGWKRTATTKGSGEEAHVTSVKWTGGDVPTGEAAVFQFVASPESAADYRFAVRQTYSDDSVVNWSGAADSDTPAPVVEAKSSLGGGGSSTLGVVALVVAGVALLLALGGLAAGRGRQLA
jgi:uncharacterized protein YcnI